MTIQISFAKVNKLKKEVREAKSLREVKYLTKKIRKMKKNTTKSHA